MHQSTVIIESSEMYILHNLKYSISLDLVIKSKWNSSTFISIKNIVNHFNKINYKQTYNSFLVMYKLRKL